MTSSSGVRCSISDYGFIGNARTGALVSKFGSIDWLCFPQFDSESYFERILDYENGGYFSISPVQEYSTQQSYIEDTNVLETIFRCASGSVRLLDLFPVAAEEDKKGELWPQHEVLRIVEPISGAVEMKMIYAPRRNYGKYPIRLRSRGFLGVAYDSGGELMLLRTDLEKGEMNIQNPHSATLQFFVTDTPISFSLTFSQVAPAVIPHLKDEAWKRLKQTEIYWRNWIEKCQYDGPYRQYVRRSALALKLLTFSPSGAVVAAPTTSLPEALGGIRNWDYRYCWLRDASFTVRAFLSLGYHEEARAYISWMLHTTHLTHPRLKVLYSVFGESEIPEKILSHLPGYQRSRPVRIGNAADKQFQLDVYGEVIDAVYRYVTPETPLDEGTRHFILGLGQAVLELWNKPDDGIWEVRSGRVHHTHSKVLSWVALDRLTKLCCQYHWKAPLDEYHKVMDKLKFIIEREGYNIELNSYVRTLLGQELDASLLVMPLLGFEKAADKRIANTRKAIEKHLCDNKFIYRYRAQDHQDGDSATDDGLTGTEGAFGICNFWLAESYALAGDLQQARKWFEAMIRSCNQNGLFAEQIDPRSGEYLGNYPQAFTHIGLISAAVRIAELEKSQHQLQNEVSL